MFDWAQNINKPLREQELQTSQVLHCQTLSDLNRITQGLDSFLLPGFFQELHQEIFYPHNGNKAVWNPTLPTHRQEQWISLAKP